MSTERDNEQQQEGDFIKKAGEDTITEDTIDEERAEIDEESAEETLPPNIVGRLYDKLPITFKQADIIAKVALAVAAVVALIAILTAPGSQ